MKALIFIAGFVAGIGATTLVASARDEFAKSDLPIVGEDQIRNEVPSLQGESDLLRLIALEHMRGMAVSEADGLLKGLGAETDLRDEGGLLFASLPDSAGQVMLEISGGKVTNVLNYCWNAGGDCAIFEVSD